MTKEVICFALKQNGVQEYLVDGVMSLYKGCKAVVYHDNGCSDKRCVGWFINGVVVCGQPSFVWEVAWGGALYDQHGV